MDTRPGEGSSDLARDLAELDRLQRLQEAAPDEDIREAYALQIQALSMRVRKHRFHVEPAEEAPVETPVPHPEEVAEVPPPPPSPAERDEAERLIRLSNVEKMRGNRQRATDLLEQAAAVAPGASSVLLALGDALLERHQLAKAREVFRRALVIEPGNASIERRYAQTVVQAGPQGLSLEAQMRLHLGGAEAGDSHASRPAAMLLSVLFPGVGHMVVGRTQTGIALLVTWLALVVWLVLMAKDLLLLTAFVGGAPAKPNLLVMVPIALLALLAVGSASSLKPGSASIRSKKPERPRPPVDLPFE